MFHHLKLTAVPLHIKQSLSSQAGCAIGVPKKLVMCLIRIVLVKISNQYLPHYISHPEVTYRILVCAATITHSYCNLNLFYYFFYLVRMLSTQNL